jgi:hypothetical protein
MKKGNCFHWVHEFLSLIMSSQALQRWFQRITIGILWSQWEISVRNCISGCRERVRATPALHCHTHKFIKFKIE